MDSNLEVVSEYGKGSTFSFAIKQSYSGSDTIGDYKLKAETVVAEDAEERFKSTKANSSRVDQDSSQLYQSDLYNV